MNIPIPANCHDVKTAAQLLNTNVFNLYKQLRKMAWVHSGASKKDPLRNTPKAWAKQQGLLIGQERGYPAPYNNQLTKIYITTLITERGLQKLVTLMDKNNTPQSIPKPMELNEQNAQLAKLKTHDAETNKEREELLAMMRKWGQTG
jgi:hypothetical protein